MIYTVFYFLKGSFKDLGLTKNKFCPVSTDSKPPTASGDNLQTSIPTKKTLVSVQQRCLCQSPSPDGTCESMRITVHVLVPVPGQAGHHLQRLVPAHVVTTIKVAHRLVLNTKCFKVALKCRLLLTWSTDLLKPSQYQKPAPLVDGTWQVAEQSGGPDTQPRQWQLRSHLLNRWHVLDNAEIRYFLFQQRLSKSCLLWLFVGYL